MKKHCFTFVVCTFFSVSAFAAGSIAGEDANAIDFASAPSPAPPMKHEDTEVYKPVPDVVIPGVTPSDPPSDAIVLFDGKTLDEWVSTDDRSRPARWKVDGGILTVVKQINGQNVGNIETLRKFKSYQLHLEWRIPCFITGKGQERGNSGVFLASTGTGDDGYELQILDSYQNPTYVNGQAGSIYKQSIPSVNASKIPGEWQVYDVVWNAPSFNADGSVQTRARVTVFYNGVLIQNNFELQGETTYIGYPKYKQYDTAPIKLQAHGDPSEPVSFRNIWVRELK